MGTYSKFVDQQGGEHYVISISLLYRKHYIYHSTKRTAVLGFEPI